MSGTKISQLPVQTNANAHTGDSIPIVDSVAGETKQITLGQLDLRYQGVPDGGTTSQLLAKASGTNKDVYWKTISKSDVGLGLVDNTSDANKPISTATQTALNLKANTSALSSYALTTTVNSQVATKQDKLPSGTDGQVLTLAAGVPVWAAGGSGGGAVNSVFGRSGNVTAQIGDYDKTMIGLDQVDNTSDLDKPISNLTQTALNAKQASLPSGTNGQMLSLVGGTPAWVAAPQSLPTGGTAGQALVKNSGTNYDVSWATVAPGITITTAVTIPSGGGALTVPAIIRQRIKVGGTGGETPMTLSDGSFDGQELYLQGVSDIAPILISAGTKLKMGFASYTLASFDTVLFIWDSGNTAWVKFGGMA